MENRKWENACLPTKQGKEVFDENPVTKVFKTFVITTIK